MKPEEQRIAIAEACGLRIPMYDAHNYFKAGGPDMRVDATALPDYLNSLDAMHEAEKGLTTAAQQNRYHSEIADTTWSNPETGCRQVVFNQLTATAAQRAEAFLKTLNLWKE